MIIQSIRSSGHLRIDQLAELTGASPVTIRRDLTELEAQGSLRRIRGGAARSGKYHENVPYHVRAAEEEEAKASLAVAAASLITDYDSVIIDNGTTCHAVARELAGRPLTALCLSLHAAATLGAVPGVRVIVPGGPVEPDTLAFLGSQVIDAVRDMRADVLLLGACSISASHGLMSATYEDAQLKKASIQSSSRRILIATASKLTQTSNFRFGAVGDITHLITTSDAPAETLAIFNDEGIDVTLV
jgi:DeoR/GlpR family transcriptional regulator of sugar metabolism